MKQFGNWKVEEAGLAWTSTGVNRFLIPAAELTETFASQREEDELLYVWIMRATEEQWLTQDDLYDLNYAFVYAAALYGSDFDYDVFDATLAEQFELFEQEDKDDESSSFNSN